ncbi:hypothetical protein JD77_04490 [Micromonospora olivasterospora]|uniref:Uncharacterized protein n=1 Tax=Micromonospora olivasterospora TaxID=1880 RepID=A0A562IES2_MICOL|nr:hypothetical protein JD77_04490 [Micromonospora olivasterospora]
MGGGGRSGGARLAWAAAIAWRGADRDTGRSFSSSVSPSSIHSRMRVDAFTPAASASARTRWSRFTGRRTPRTGKRLAHAIDAWTYIHNCQSSVLTHAPAVGVPVRAGVMNTAMAFSPLNVLLWPRRDRGPQRGRNGLSAWNGGVSVSPCRCRSACQASRRVRGVGSRMPAVVCCGRTRGSPAPARLPGGDARHAGQAGRPRSSGRPRGGRGPARRRRRRCGAGLPPTRGRSTTTCARSGWSPSGRRSSVNRRFGSAVRW